MTLYIEYLSFSTFFTLFHKGLLPPFFGNKEIKTCYFIDGSLVGQKLADFMGIVIGYKFEKLGFKMMDIKDEDGELVRIRIPMKDLINIQQDIINNDSYRVLKDNSWNNNRVEKFIQKGIIDGGINEKVSASRVLYIINVAYWHMQQIQQKRGKFIICQRPWFETYRKYSKKYGIELIDSKKIPTSFLKKIKNSLLNIIKQNPKFYIFINNMRNGRHNDNFGDISASEPLLYIEGRGDVNIKNDGKHSDFFWVMNSDFPPQNVLYDFHSETEKKLLNEFGVKLNDRKIIYNSNGNIKLQINKASEFKEEKKEIKSLLSSYQRTKSYWYSLFNTNNVKLFLTWFKYSKDHIAIADAIKDNGGITAVWQMAFNGAAFIGCQTFTDLIFSHSNYSSTLEEQLNSQYSYNIIMGYPKDYAAPLLKRKASILRNKLKSHGAKKIIFSIDENSIDDDRWHTGHQLQRENYSYILEKVLENPWLGVVFKPKTVKTLRRRLGEVNELLVEAEKTGRCKIFEDSGRHTTLSPPILAGLVADVCIHGHLSAGTSAVECALEGLPTLLIDREGFPKSDLYKLPKGKVIFNNWPDAIDTIMEHFQTPKGIPDFGDWSDYLDEFDSFRDGKGAYRMGTYLHWLIQGFEQGLDREIIMADAAERYAKEWGSDKVIFS
jgi:hypothetical protein